MLIILLLFNSITHCDSYVKCFNPNDTDLKIVSALVSSLNETRYIVTKEVMIVVAFLLGG